MSVLSIDGIGTYDHVYRSSMMSKLLDVPGLQKLLVRKAYSQPSRYAWERGRSFCSVPVPDAYLGCDFFGVPKSFSGIQMLFSGCKKLFLTFQGQKREGWRSTVGDPEAAVKAAVKSRTNKQQGGPNAGEAKPRKIKAKKCGAPKGGRGEKRSVFPWNFGGIPAIFVTFG